MKLSEAIRLGGMATPQCRNADLFDGEATCALGGAALAAGFQRCDEEETRGYDFLKKRWPWLRSTFSACPVGGCGKHRDDAMAVIYHLNDSHDWTREQIADLVATIEPQEAPSPAPAQQEAVTA